MSKIFVIFFMLLFSVHCYGITIMERLKMPSNKPYFKNFQLSLNLLNIKAHKSNMEHVSNNVSAEPDIYASIKLTGIFKIGDKFFAIINGEAYTVGSEINGYKILSVDIRKVLLCNKKNNERVALKIEN